MTPIPDDAMKQAEEVMKPHGFLKAVHSTSGKDPYDRLLEDIALAIAKAQEEAANGVHADVNYEYSKDHGGNRDGVAYDMLLAAKSAAEKYKRV